MSWQEHDDLRLIEEKEDDKREEGNLTSQFGKMFRNKQDDFKENKGRFFFISRRGNV